MPNDTPGAQTAPASAHSSAYIVDQILPTNQIHLIFGPESTDKTVLLLQILRDWLRRDKIFDRESYPTRYCWVSCEQNTSAVQSHMHALGINPSTTFHYSLLEVDRPSADHCNLNIDTAVLMAQRQSQSQSHLVLFIDGLHALCEGRIICTRDVTKFLDRVHYLMRRYHLTILATVASPKTRPEDSTTPPGERFLGSGSWASMSRTKILIEPIDPMDPMHAGRKVIIMPPNNKAQILRYERHEDGLILMAQGDTPQCPLDDWLDMQPSDQLVSTINIQTAGQTLELSRATIYRWIDQKLESNRLDRVSKGLYKIIPRPIT